MANHNIETGRCAVLPRRFGQLWQRADELDPPYDAAFDEELWHKVIDHDIREPHTLLYKI